MSSGPCGPILLVPIVALSLFLIVVLSTVTTLTLECEVYFIRYVDLFLNNVNGQTIFMYQVNYVLVEGKKLTHLALFLYDVILLPEY